MNLQENIRKVFREELDKKQKVFYTFSELKNHWVDDNDRSYHDEFFDNKDYEDFHFDNFYDMDEMFGHENSLFGTRGLPVGHPDRSSKSFNYYNKKFGPMIVRVIKNNDLQESIRRILREESNSTQSIVNDIKKSLIMEILIDEDEFNELYDGDWDLAWKEFVDNQEIGDCQGIVSFVIHDFPNVEKVFGEIEVDEPYIDEYGDEQTLMTHHWVEINGEPFDFSKGTLKNYIDWDNMYDPKIDEEYRYNEL